MDRFYKFVLLELFHAYLFKIIWYFHIKNVINPFKKMDSVTREFLYLSVIFKQFFKNITGISIYEHIHLAFKKRTGNILCY